MYVVRSRAFQLTAEEARVALDVVTGMFLLLTYLFILIFIAYICVLLLVSFLMNDIFALVIFDLGVTLSSVALALNKRFVDAPVELKYPLEVEIADNRLVRVSRVHRGCVLELFSEHYPIDLVPIPLRESKVIVGMYWLSPNGK